MLSVSLKILSGKTDLFGTRLVILSLSGMCCLSFLEGLSGIRGGITGRGELGLGEDVSDCFDTPVKSFIPMFWESPDKPSHLAHSAYLYIQP